jgi:5-methylcytosine-specific restriction endonuclease McrA
MNSIRSDPSTMRLDPMSYGALRQRVLRRDDWRCQLYGKMTNLEVHHKQFRSHSGNDSEENLITLCVGCHGAMHVSSCFRLR